MGRQDHSVFKQAVRVATTADITLSGTQTIDGVAVGAGQRVLVKDQTAGDENGIYVCATGLWARATDFDHVNNVVPGASIPISEGLINGDQTWKLTTDHPIEVGTTALVFSTADPDTEFSPRIHDIYHGETFYNVNGGTLPEPWVATQHVFGGAGGTPEDGYASFGKTWQGLWVVPEHYYALSCDNANESQQLNLSHDDDRCIMPSNWFGTGQFLFDFCVNFAAEGGGAPHASSTWVAGVAAARGAGAVNLDTIEGLWIRQDGGTVDYWIEGDDGITNTRINTGLDNELTDIRVRFDMSNLQAVRVYINNWNGSAFVWTELAQTVNMFGWSGTDVLQPFFEVQKNSNQRELLLVKYFKYHVRWW
jgi:hypothetical protein